jgi:hypothetical protein
MQEEQPLRYEMDYTAEEMRSLTWFQARVPDKGAGATRLGLFVQAPSKDRARELIDKSDRYNVYDGASADLHEVDDGWDTVEHGMRMAGGYPNEALGHFGSVTRRSDL